MRTPGGLTEIEQNGLVAADVGASDLGFVDRYLARIGLTTSDVSGPDLDDHQILERIVRAQLATIPFENLMIHADQIIDVAPSAIERKILGNRRGGVCYEVNGLLARALRTLGFDVIFVGAAVAGESGEFGPPLAHMALIVTRDDRYWLVDTGFGGSSVLMTLSADQILTPMDIHTQTGRYRTDGISHQLNEFADIAHWHSTSPNARVRRSVICCITDDTHRITMSRAPGEHFTLTQTDLTTDDKTRSTIADDAVCALFDKHFGITLETPPVAADLA